ncbi:unnamed protein product [Adineta steineri]|uniref:SMP-30/Gluconolactonase/LRE-like region domain-containing protein n=1 Tax=Adineta steineri TaxID=433720 RepID=A0A813WKS2_9BILA|nr:unnamed protein product [Adineta steineri]
MATAVLPKHDFHISTDDKSLEIFSLIWLDATVNVKDTRDTEVKLRSIINHIKKFQYIKQCQQYIQQTSQKDRLVVIVSGQLGQEIIPHIHQLRQVISIYVYCMDKKSNEQWAYKFAKIKSVVVDLNELVSQITTDHKIQKKIEEPLSINIFTTSVDAGKSLLRVNGQFVFSQILVDCLLRLKSTETDKNELINCCQNEYEGNHTELDNLREFQQDYSSDKVLMWYTKETFFYKTLNAALRTQNIHMIFLFRSFIYDIYRQLQKYQSKRPLQVYRSQLMSNHESDRLKINIGQFISINSMFSTSKERTTALFYLGDITTKIDSERVLFEIDADPKIVNTKPFANISKHSYFPDESEVLFMIGSIFRLNNINLDDDQIWIIKMTLCNDDELDLKQVLVYMKQQINSEETNLQILGKLLWKMGKLDLAHKYFNRLLQELQSNDPLLSSLYEDLGELASQTGDYDMSVQWHQKSLAIKNKNQVTVSPTIKKTNNSIEQSNDAVCAPVGRIDAKTDILPANTQTIINQIKYVMAQMHELHEFTTPRYFFIFPAKHSDRTILNTVREWYHLHYKLYFLCECSDEPDKMHVAPHNGYSIKKTREFVVKYEPYLRTTLKIAQVLLKLGSFVIPQLDSVSEAAGSGVDEILPTPDKQKEMEEQLKLVEKLLDRVVHQWAQSKSTMLGQDKSRGVPLQEGDLREVETYLEVADNKRSLGNLYPTVTVDGHVRWVCLEHYDDFSFNNEMLKYIDQLVAIGEQSVLFNHINITTKWKQHGITIAGDNGYDNQLNQLDYPQGIYVDDDHQTIYIADCANHRIVEWKYGAKNGQVVAGGNRKGNRSDQLNNPRDVIVDKTNDSIIICDWGNRRVIRWSPENGTNGETIISNIDCYGLTMDKNGDLYVSDYKRNEVTRWKQGETEGTIVAGGNGQGNQLNQLYHPTYIFVDEDHSVYVSDTNNDRVMKWMKGAKEGIVVAGGNGKGNILTQLSNPQGAIVDHLGNVYVADCYNGRIMRWCEGSWKGSIVVGGNQEGRQPDQFDCPKGLSFDVQGNLYVVDCGNGRIQKFEIDLYQTCRF